MQSNKTFKFEIKQYGEPGTFEGLASTYGNVDLGGDIVEPGAFYKTIQDKGGNFPILWQHNSDKPIGIGKVSDSANGLVIKGELVLESPTAREAYALLKAGVLKGLSIGYDKVRDEVKGAVRHLTELKLWEVSLVTFPMNEMAMVSAVKNQKDFLARLEAVEAEQSNLKALVERYAAQAPIVPPAAKYEEDAPELLHPPLDRIHKLLQGVQ